MLEGSSVNVRQTRNEIMLTRRPWTSIELSLLESGSSEAINLLRLSGRSDAAIRIKKSEMGISNRQPWTEKQKNDLTNNYGKVSAKELEALIGRDINSIYAMAHKMKLTKTVLHDPWTEEQITILKKDYPRYPADQVAKLIGKTRSQVYSKAHEMKIKRYSESKSGNTTNE